MNPKPRSLLLLWTVALLPLCGSSAAQPTAQDDPYRASILVVVAHPDDELMAATYLAKASLDQRKRVAVVFATRGDAGGNLVGTEQGASLAAIREIEARNALALIDVHNVWFLGAPDTPPGPGGHDVFRSLAQWNHGARVAEVVRFIRLTRPSVVLTFLPDIVVGENHQDHQAAGVIATEAFDLAGDPTAFPEQLASPQDPRGFGQLVEGLRPWQPQKLYYFSDAEDQSFLAGLGPAYPVTEKSSVRGGEYFRLWLAMAAVYRTQYQGLPAADGDPPAGFAPPPRQFLLGKSLVGGKVDGDVLEATRSEAIAFAPAPTSSFGDTAPSHAWLELGGAWAFYRRFWRTHGLDSLLQSRSVAEIGVGSGQPLPVPLLLHNPSLKQQSATLSYLLPAGWKETAATPTSYELKAGETRPVTLTLLPPADAPSRWHELEFSLQTQSRPTQSTRLKVYVNGAD